MPAPPISIPTAGWRLKPLACEFEAKKKAASHANPQDWVVFDEACEVAAPAEPTSGSFCMVFKILTLCCTDSKCFHRGYGATAARLTPDQKVGSLNLSGLMLS